MKNTTNKDQAFRSHCPVNYALEMLGDKWSLLIVRDCLIANKTAYSDFLQSREGISTNILADRLKKLEANGMLEKFPDPLNSKKTIYLLAEKSIALAPMITEMIDWAALYDKNTEAPNEIIKRLKKDRHAFSKKLQSNYRTHSKAIRKKLALA